jgi:hypothetical protein
MTEEEYIKKYHELTDHLFDNVYRGTVIRKLQKEFAETNHKFEIGKTIVIGKKHYRITTINAKQSNEFTIIPRIYYSCVQIKKDGTPCKRLKIEKIFEYEIEYFHKNLKD